MKAFRSVLDELAGFDELARKMRDAKGMLQVTGCIDSQKAHFIDALGAPYGVKLIVAADDLRAKEIYENMRFFDREVMYFPAKDFIFFQADVQSSLLMRQRIAVLERLASGKDATIVTTITALMSRMMPFDLWENAALSVDMDTIADLDMWKNMLASFGYERAGQVDRPGQYAIRGGIVDIFPLTEENPVRIELFDDEIDSIRMFDAASQRSIENLREIVIRPASEIIMTEEVKNTGLEKIRKEAEKQKKKLREAMKTEEAHRAGMIAEDLTDKLEQFNDFSGLDSFLKYFYPQTYTLEDYIPADAAIFLDEPNRLEEAADAAETEFRESMSNRLEKGYVLPGQTDILRSAKEVEASLSRRGCVGFCLLEGAGSSWKVTDQFTFDVRSVSPYNNSFETLTSDLTKWKKNKYRIIVMSASRTRGTRLAQDLTDQGLTAFYTEDLDREVTPGQILITFGSTHRGYEYPMLKFVVIAESDIFGAQKKPRRKQRMFEGKGLTNFGELTPGDYVVHESHGLGVYKGIEQIESDHVMKDYMKIEYQGGSCLYVPASNLNVIQKYADSDAKKPKLNKLGGQEWNRTRSKVRGAVMDIAKDLVQLYSARQNADGYEYGPDTSWQQEFEELFPFEETTDQLQAIEDTKRDMMSRKIMDRLICGDVGYGKTEIAIRAAFKAVQESKQVVYLVPTTILAQQHYKTFLERLHTYPLRIEQMSRFRTASEQKRIIAELKQGQVDIVIGTHRLLSKDVQFKDLGLLIVDEEQRFGVAAKEKIKQMKKNVDVLTLTATPIPRTLHMSLIGIRDMSVLEEAPQDRLPIQTYVMEYNEELVREAINREMARGGQVYYVYNKVSSIMDVAEHIAKLVPQANVAFAHGQMHERELEKIMYDFINGNIDVLVSTTIIETGLDIPNANTMIVHDADTLGLSQLYQLRGRIGRSTRTSFAFLMYKRDKMLREVAEKRLAAIREFTELGSGFKIAMRDLEIRGAGNLLGAQQHGHMAAVGYDMYCRMLNEAVREVKGEDVAVDTFDTTIDVDVDAYIPDRYIRNSAQKMDIYKRIAAISSQDDYDDMLSELMDRFGEPSRSVYNLLKVALLRAQAHNLWIRDLSQKGDEILFTFYEKPRLNVENVEPYVSSYKGRMKIRLGRETVFVYAKPKKGGQDGNDILALIGKLLEEMQVLKEESSPAQQ